MNTNNKFAETTQRLKCWLGWQTACVIQLEIFVRQLCNKVRIWFKKNGLGLRIYKVWRCKLYESRTSESRKPPIFARYGSYKNYLRKFRRNIPNAHLPKKNQFSNMWKWLEEHVLFQTGKEYAGDTCYLRKNYRKLVLDWRNLQENLWFDLHSWRVCLQHQDELHQNFWI